MEDQTMQILIGIAILLCCLCCVSYIGGGLYWYLVGIPQFLNSIFNLSKPPTDTFSGPATGDCQGGEINSMIATGVSLDACKQSCLNNSLCTGISYSNSQQRCVPKTSTVAALSECAATDPAQHLYYKRIRSSV